MKVCFHVKNDLWLRQCILHNVSHIILSRIVAAMNAAGNMLSMPTKHTTTGSQEIDTKELYWSISFIKIREILAEQSKKNQHKK